MDPLKANTLMFSCEGGSAANVLIYERINGSERIIRRHFFVDGYKSI